jgi:hypothetical protein
VSVEEVSELEGTTVTVKYAKLAKAVTGQLKTMFGGAAIIYTPDGIYGMFPHLIEHIEVAG